MTKKIQMLFIFSICFAFLSFSSFAKDDVLAPELNKKRSDPDYILTDYTKDIYKTTDYGAITIKPSLKTIKLAGIDYSEFGLGRNNLRTVLKTENMFPLKVYVMNKVSKRYNTECAILVSSTLKVTVQDVLIKEGFVKASDECLDQYPFYKDKFKKLEDEARTAQKGIWAK